MSSVRSAFRPTGSGWPPMLKSREPWREAPKSAYTRSVHRPHWPLRAWKVPMKANFSASITSPMLTSMLGPPPLGGNEVVPLMPGNQP